MKDERRKVLLRGQPQRGAARRATVPIRFEKLLVRAAAEPTFREALVADPEAAAAAIGMALSDTERGMLRAMSEARLLAMIDGIDIDRHTRRPFGRSVAAAVFAAAAASTVVATDCGCGGDTADWPPDVVGADTAQPLADGISGDVVTVEVYDPGPDEGVRPDLPDVVDVSSDSDIYDGAARGAMADVPEDDSE